MKKEIGIVIESSRRTLSRRDLFGKIRVASEKGLQRTLSMIVTVIIIMIIVIGRDLCFESNYGVLADKPAKPLALHVGDGVSRFWNLDLPALSFIDWQIKNKNKGKIKCISFVKDSLFSFGDFQFLNELLYKF